MSSKGQTTPDVKHPYFPKSLKMPHYVPNNRSSTEIWTVMIVVAILIISASWYLTGRRGKEPFCFMRRAVLCWFMLCAFIHTFLEGYFAIYHATLAGHSSLLGETWKEYSLGDSRYLISDTFTVCMESITALVDGPLAFVCFFAFIRGSDYRYVFQMILSLCQLYGDSLYFMTAKKEDFIYGPKGHTVYFWFYFFTINMIWIIVPIALIIDAARHMASCQVVSDFYTDEYNRKVKNPRKAL